MPQLLNDECIVPSLTSRGMPLDESRDYIAVGCDEISLHRHWARCNGGYINMAKILEITLGNGTDLRYKVPVFDPVEEKPENDFLPEGNDYTPSQSTIDTERILRIAGSLIAVLLIVVCLVNIFKPGKAKQKITDCTVP